MAKSLKVLGLGVVMVFGFSGPQLAQAAPLDTQCWTQQECHDYIATSKSASGSVTKSTSFSLPENWVPVAECPTTQGYCYQSPPTIKLIIPLGQLGEVKGIAGYVAALFTIILALASILSVLIIMVAGLMWMTARGNPSAVGKARDLITSSLTSIVILMSVSAIASFIDPNLARLMPIKTPAMKTGNLISQGTSCESLIKTYHMTVSPTSGKCGSAEGKITDVGEAGKGSNIAMGVKVGDVCKWTTCSGSAQKCIQTNKGDTCMRCGMVDDSNELGVTPSQSLCSSLAVDPKVAGLNEQTHLYCNYFDTKWYSLDMAGDSCTELVYPAGSPGVDCGEMKKNFTTCDGYNKIKVQANGVSWVKGDTIIDFAGQDDDYALLKSVCDVDVCNLSANGAGCQVSTVVIDAGSNVTATRCIPR